MRRISSVLVVALLALAGCGSGDDAEGASPRTTAPGTSVSPSPAQPTPGESPETVIEFTVDGAGPYELGAALSALQSGPGLQEVSQDGACPENIIARGTGVWSDVQLHFRNDQKLYMLVNRSTSIPTPSGAWLGTTLNDLKSIYRAVPTQELTRGPNAAFLVTTINGRGILFELNESQQVTSMAAADAHYLRTGFLSGSFC